MARGGNRKTLVMVTPIIITIITVDVIAVTTIKHQRRVIGVGYSACGRATLTDLPLFFLLLVDRIRMKNSINRRPKYSGNKFLRTDGSRNIFARARHHHVRQIHEAMFTQKQSIASVKNDN